MKQFGVTKPRSFDYFLAFAFALIAMSSLLVGLWVAFGNGWDMSFEAINLSLRALSGLFAGSYMLFVTAMSVVFYVGVLFSLTMLLLALFKKDFRALPGSLALILLSLAFACQIGFIVTFYSYFSGLFTAFLVFFMLLEIILAVMDIRLLWYRLVVDSKFYTEYMLDYPELFECTCEEECEHSEEYEALDKQEEHEEAPAKRKTKLEKKSIMLIDNDEPPMDEFQDDATDVATDYAADDDADVDDEQLSGEQNEFAGMKAKSLTFEQRLKLAKPITKERFEDIRSFFESLGFKAVRTRRAETFVYKNSKYAQISTAGKTGLKIYYKLDAKDYADSSIPVTDVSSVKKYEKTPLLFSVKSDLSVKRAKKLMQDVVEKNEISK